MANFTLKRVDLFPAGTNVDARKRTLFGNIDPQRGVAPPGAAEQTVASDGTQIPFVGLTDDTSYVFSGQVGGVWQHVSARTRALASSHIFDVKTYGAKGDGITDDTAAINAAIADLVIAAGGTLYFPAGTYSTSGGHSITVPCQLRGDGRGTIGAGNGVSTLSLRNGANTSMLLIASKSVTISDLGLYGNKGNQAGTSHGIVSSAVTSCSFLAIERVWVDSFLSDGINLSTPGTSLGAALANVESRTNTGRGLTINAGAADCSVDHSLFDQNGASGISVSAAGCQFTAVHSWGNGTLVGAADTHGLIMPAGAPGRCRFVGCYFESNGNATNGGRGAQPRGKGNQFTGCYFYNNRSQGVYAFSCTSNTFTGCDFHNNNLNAAAGANGAGILLDTCTACAVAGNVFYDDQGVKTQTYGIAEANASNYMTYHGNVSRALDHLTGNWLMSTGANNMPLAANMATVNVG